MTPQELEDILVDALGNETEVTAARADALAGVLTWKLRNLRRDVVASLVYWCSRREVEKQRATYQMWLKRQAVSV